MDHEWRYAHHSFYVHVQIYHPWDAVLLRCCILRERAYTDNVLCAQRCGGLLRHLSGSRNCVHYLSIDEEWSLHDAMLLHAFCFLQGTRACAEVFFRKVQPATSTSPVT